MAIPGYRIVRKIRQGGMSTVYLAIQKSVDREVAIKVMSPSLASDPSFGSRFYREAKIVGQLSHPNIVSIYDVGSYKHYNYIAMDYLPGAPLQDRLERGIATPEAIRIVREMASALDYAHERGYIHRDIKPDNILFRDDGSAVLCDFGIAKALKGNIKMTNIGSVLGTPHYMSPEQAQGKEIDGRADIYSLGVVFYEMLSGQVPFGGDDPVSVAVKHMSSPIPKLPAAQKAFQPIIEKMMAKRTSERYQTGREVIEALNALEASLKNTGQTSPTQTGSTTVQVIGLVTALLSSLTTAISLAFKRLMLTNITFASSTVQLSNKQLDDIDSFILSDSPQAEGSYDDLPIIQDTVEQPAIRRNFRWLYWALCLGIIVGGGYYLFLRVPEVVPVVMKDIAAPVEVPAPATTPTPAPTPKPEQQEAPTRDTETEATASTDEPEPAPEPEPTPRFALTINTEPADATVKVLNIKPVYKPGMKLEPGAYHIAVDARDYFPKRIWLRIDDAAVTRTVHLEPTRRLLSPGSEIADKLTDGSNGPRMIVLPQGQLTPASGGEPVGIDQPVAMARHEVTFADYRRFVEATDRAMPDDFGWGRDQRPVVDVSYHDARDYAAWLSEQTGETYRLPTHSEWAYAARGGSTARYWWEGDADDKANCRRGCDSEFSRLFGSSTAPVGTYPANPFGLHDTAGNVGEWLAGCNSWQDAEQSICASANVAGGSHADRDDDIGPTAIQSANATEGSETIGFRLLLEL